MHDKEGDLKVWWICQVGMRKRFEVPVANLVEARLPLDVLADYDDFQFKNRVKPDYCNTGGVLRFDDGEWTDWSVNDAEIDAIKRLFPGEAFPQSPKDLTLEQVRELQRELDATAGKAA